MFLSLKWRPNKWPLWILIALEFPVTVALLALFGIAAPNLYRTKLWADGAANGFNSSPTTGLYAAANYRPYTAPKVWSQFITNFNLVISVFSMFVMLAKSAMYILNVFPPLLSVVAHAAVVAIYTVSVVYQASSDMSDPKRPQPGPPWYITKSCSVAHDKSLIGYCQQAKAAFACSVLILIIFAAQLGLSIWSCFPSSSHRAAREAKRIARESKYAHLDDSPTSETKVPAMSLNEFPTNPNTPHNTSTSALNPMTPRTLAFNRLGGTKDLPLRNHFNTGGAADGESNDRPTSTSRAINFSSRFALRSPTFPGSPLSPGFERAERKVDEEMGQRREGDGGDGAPGMYFPPPPKVAVKDKGGK